MTTTDVVRSARIVLRPHEVEMAAGVGLRRHLDAMTAGRADRHGFDGEGWSIHIEGACGELAVAKFLHRYWDGSNGTFRLAPDVPGVEVRTRSSHAYELIIRPDDDPDAVFILVTGRAPNLWVRGWLRARDARREAWWQTHGGRPGAWFVPTAQLRNDWPPS